MEQFFVQNAMYVVLTIVLIGWFGIFFYLLRLDRKISRLEERRKGGAV